VIVTALVHGNELCGAWALSDWLALMHSAPPASAKPGWQPASGSWTFAFCNLTAFDRFDPLQHDASRFVDEDFNRVWSAPRLAGTSVEAQRARDLEPFVRPSERQPTWLLDLHSMHEPGPPLTLAGLQSRNLALARHLAAGHVVVDPGHAEGVRLRDYALFGRLDELTADGVAASNACSLLVECGFHGALSSREVARDCLARFLVASGTLGDGADAATEALARLGWLTQTLPTTHTQLRVTQAIVARDMGFRFAEPLGRPVRALDVLPKAGSVIAHHGDGEPVFTPYNNCALVMPSLRQLRPGVTVVRLAQASVLEAFE
jgi:hypothetical protein